jgi:hypothetical protein
MFNLLTVSGYLLPPPIVPSIGLLADEPQSQVDPLGRLAELAALVAKNRAALKKQSERLEKFYHQAGRAKATAEELEEAARIILNNERELATTFVPQIEKFKQNLAQKHPPTSFARSLRRSTEELLDITQTWLEIYQNLRIRLLKLASDRRVAAGETGSPVLSDAVEMERYLRRIAEG